MMYMFTVTHILPIFVEGHLDFTNPQRGALRFCQLKIEKLQPSPPNNDFSLVSYSTHHFLKIVLNTQGWTIIYLFIWRMEVFKGLVKTMGKKISSLAVKCQ